MHSTAIIPAGEEKLENTAINDVYNELEVIKNGWSDSASSLHNIFSRLDRLFNHFIKEPARFKNELKMVSKCIDKVWTISTYLRAMVEREFHTVSPKFFYLLVFSHPKVGNWREDFKWQYFLSLLEEMNTSAEAAASILRKTSTAFFEPLPHALTEQIAVNTFRNKLNGNLSIIPDSVLLKFLYLKTSAEPRLEALAKIAVQDFRDEFPGTFTVSEAKDKYRLVTNILKSRFPNSAPSLLERSIVRYSFKMLGQVRVYPAKFNIIGMLDKVEQSLNHLVNEVTEAANVALKERYNNELSTFETRILKTELAQFFINKLLKDEVIPIPQFAECLAKLLKIKTTHRVQLPKRMTEKEEKPEDFYETLLAGAHLEKDKPILINIAVLNKGEQEKLPISFEDLDRLAKLAVLEPEVSHSSSAPGMRR